MKRSNAWVRRLEHWLLRPILSLLERRDPESQTPAAPRKVLLCKSCCLGDAVISLYAVRAFKQAHPGVRLEILCSDRIREVYDDSPWIDAVHSLPVTGRKLGRELLSPAFLGTLIRTMGKLRSARFDRFIDLELYRTYGPALKRMLGIPHSRGFHVEGLPKPAHDAVYFRARFAPEWQCFFGVLGLPVPAAAPEPLYPLPLPADNRPPSTRKVIGVVFGSSFNWPEKKWPLENFAAVLASLASSPVEFVLFGAGFEAGEARRLKQASPDHTRSTVGRLDFAGLKRELAGCDLVFGNDTGTLHVAAACGVATLALFGPTPPEKWKPMNGEALFLPEIPCRPCYYLGTMPECSHRNCLTQMRPERVADSIRKRLAL